MNVWSGDELNYLLNRVKVRDKRDDEEDIGEEE